jgi:hypothetical protein
MCVLEHWFVYTFSFYSLDILLFVLTFLHLIVFAIYGGLVISKHCKERNELLCLLIVMVAAAAAAAAVVVVVVVVLCMAHELIPERCKCP